MKARKYKLKNATVFNACKQALENLGFDIESSNLRKGEIQATSGISFRSWGENVNIRITSISSSTKVRISSKSPAQLIDWGKSQENEEKIFDELEKIIG